MDNDAERFLGATKCSNNSAELSAIAEALRFILANIEEIMEAHITIRYDSHFARASVMGECAVSLQHSVLIMECRSCLKSINDQRRAAAKLKIIGRAREPRDSVEANRLVFQHVKGHSGDFGNDWVDARAKQGALGFTSAMPMPVGDQVLPITQPEGEVHIRNGIEEPADEERDEELYQGQEDERIEK